MKPMRTYCRKRAGFQEIEGVHGLCRLCLAKAEDPVPIFTQQTTDVSALAIRIMICVGLELSNDECLPNIICSHCLEELERYYAFRKKCESSYQKLKSHQAAIKLKIYKEELENESIKETNSTQAKQGLKILRSDCNEANKMYFKLQPDGVVQICNETNNMDKFVKQTLVSILKVSEPGTNRNSILDIQNNTNTEIHPKTNSLLKINNIHTIENNEQCNKLNFTNEEIDTASNNEIFYVQEIVDQVNSMDVTHDTIENDSNINDSENMKIHLFDIGENTTCRVLIDEVENADQHSTVEINDLAIESNEPEVKSNRVADHTGIVDDRNLEIDNNVVMENNKIADERHEGNLVINEMDTDEVTNDNAGKFSNDNETEHASLPEALTMILVQLGLLIRHGEDLVVLDHRRTVELETGEGARHSLEFVEEDEDPEGPEPIVHPDMEMSAAEKLKSLAKNKKFSKEFRDILDTNLVCHACGKRFPTKSGLRRHTRHVHGGQRPHLCNVCGKAFAQKEVMLRHELVHKEVRPFQCASCPKSFTQRAALAAHARAHAPPHARWLELYPCPRCPKVFLYPSEVRPFQCASCPMSFTLHARWLELYPCPRSPKVLLYPSGLSRHTMTHSGRVFSCDGCQKAFKDKSSLKRHMKTAQHGLPAAPAAVQPAPAEGHVDQNVTSQNELVDQNVTAENELVGQNMAS